MRLGWGKTAVGMVLGDITEQDVDAIVNAANSSLMGGGGVDGAIHRRGGPRILEECRQIRRETWPEGLPSGKAVMTSDRSSLGLAKEGGLESVAFPAISTGAYGYPLDEAASVALRSVKEFVEREWSPRSVDFVLFSDASLRAYESAASELGG